MKYILTGITSGAIVRLEYCENGIAVIDLSEARHLNTGQRQWLCAHLPQQEALLPGFAEGRFKVQAEKIEVTFDLFYDTDNHKVGRNKAQIAWKRLSEAEQLKAYLYISTYKRDLKLNTWKTPLYPATYLNQKRWED